MSVGRTADGVRGVSENEVLVMFHTLDGNVTARNIRKRHKIE